MATFFCLAKYPFGSKLPSVFKGMGFTQVPYL